MDSQEVLKLIPKTSFLFKSPLVDEFEVQWGKFAPYANNKFKERINSRERFKSAAWEMFAGCFLIDHGCALKKMQRFRLRFVLCCKWKQSLG